MKKVYNNALDYWRIFFALIVVEYHRSITCGGIMRGGYIAVDFFFMVSGYFMIQSFTYYREANKEIDIGKQTIIFLLKKFGKIYPYILANCIINFYLLQKEASIAEFINRIRFVVYDLLLLNMAGFSEGASYVNWYISGMFLAMFILYPILLYFQERYIYIFSPIFAILIYGWISQNVGNIRGTEITYYGILRLGVWRAIAGICMGSVCWVLSHRLSQIKLTLLGKLTISLGMLISIFVIISNMIVYPLSQQDFVSLIFIVILVILILSQQGILYHLYNAQVGKWFQQWSVALFFMAGPGANISLEINMRSRLLRNIMYYIGAFVCAGLTMIFIKFVRKIKWTKRLLIDEFNKGI